MDIMDNPDLFWCIIGIIGGAISSFLISLYFYLKSFKKKKILFSEKHSDGIFPCFVPSSLLNNVDRNKYNFVHYKIKIAGKSSIEANDFTELSPLRINFCDDYKVTDDIQIKIEQNRCAMACQGCGAVLLSH